MDLFFTYIVRTAMQIKSRLMYKTEFLFISQPSVACYLLKLLNFQYSYSWLPKQLFSRSIEFRDDCNNGTPYTFSFLPWLCLICMSYISVTSATVLTCILIQSFGIILKFQFRRSCFKLHLFPTKHVSHWDLI